MEASVKRQIEEWLKSHKAVGTALELLEVEEGSALFDIAEGYEFSLRFSQPLGEKWAFEMDEDEEDEDEDEDEEEDEEEDGTKKWLQHMEKFVAARKRTLGDVLEEAKNSFERFLDEDSDSDDGGEDEEEYMDWVDEEPVKKEKKRPSDYVDPSQFTMPKIAKGAATQRLIADYAALKKVNVKDVGFEAAPINKNLYRWSVKLYPPSDTDLYKDLQKVKKKLGIDAIELEMLFPSEYPNDPPFIRVVRPRIAFHTGHVTIGGSICMDLLTTSGWSPVNSIETVLIQIITEMAHGNGRLDLNNTTPYNIQEAKAAFIRVANHHKWKVPNMNNLPWQ